MARVMLIDVIYVKYLWIISGVACAIILSAFITGLAGPETYVHNEITSLDKGVFMGMPDTTFDYTIPHNFTLLDGFWSLALFPYHKGETYIFETLIIETSIYGTNPNMNGSWDVIQQNTTEDQVLFCESAFDECWGFVLIYEDTIQYETYRVLISFPDQDNSAKKNITNVNFQFTWYNSSFMVEELIVRILFLVISTGLLVIFLAVMSRIEFSEWTIEQKLLPLLLLGLVALNDPLYPFEFLASGWLFPTIDCFFQVTHIALLLLFWLFLFDNFKKNETELKIQGYDFLKVVAVLIYSALILVFYIWFRLSHQFDPLFGQTQGSNVSGLMVLFFTCSLAFICIGIWIFVLVIMAAPIVWANKDHISRYLVVAIPSAVIMLSTVIGIFFGTIGPVRRTAESFIYFFTLYNVVVWILTIAYWPIRPGFFGSKKDTEFTPILSESENPAHVFNP